MIVPVVHVVVEHNCVSSAIEAVSVRSDCANSRPYNVRVVVDEVGMFVLDKCDRTGTSYENNDIRVPTTAETVIEGGTLIDEPGLEMHTKRVLLVQLVDAQAVAPRCAVGVWSEFAKLVPNTLSVCPPVPGEFDIMLERIGASKEKTIASVPTTALMVTVALRLTPYDLASAMRHCTVVAEFHDDVLHGVEEIPIEGDVLYVPPNESP
jgi:hypothetical protein